MTVFLSRFALLMGGMLLLPLTVSAEKSHSNIKNLLSLPTEKSQAKNVVKVQNERTGRFNLFRETQVNLITSYSLASQIKMDMRFFGTNSETVVNVDGEGSTSGAPGLGLEAVVYQGRSDLDITAGFLFEFQRTIDAFSLTSGGVTVESTSDGEPEPKVSIFTPLIGASVGLSKSLSLLLGAGVSLPLYANSNLSIRGSYHGQAGFNIALGDRFSVDVLYKYQRGELDQLDEVDFGDGEETTRISGPASLSGVAAQLKYRL